MASKNQGTVLYAPDGREWETSSQEEVVNLLAQGYSENKPKPADAKKATAAAEQA